MRTSVIRVLAAFGLAAAAVSTAGWVVTGLIEPRFSFFTNDISDLGALTAHHALAYNVSDSTSGILTVGLAVALMGLGGRRWAVVGGGVLVALAGVGSFVDGLAREDCSVSVSAACRAAEQAGRVSFHHKVHNIESLATFVVLILAPLVLGLAFWGMPGWRLLAWWSIAAGLVQAVCLPVFLTMYAAGATGQGLVEIVGAIVSAAWLVAMSLAVLGRLGGTSRMSTR